MMFAVVSLSALAQTTAESTESAWEGDLKDSDVDEFCSGHSTRRITGSLILKDTDRVDLSALSCLTKVGGLVQISRNDLLTSLDGLEQLSKVDSTLEIEGNEVLADLDGLKGLKSITN
jgi:hypothetical protein